MYELRYLPPAKKYFKKIKNKQLQLAFQNALTKIAENPTCGEQKTGDLQGFWGYDVFYDKTNYEIAYKIIETPEKTVVVILAGTRENFYKELKQYING